MENVDWDGVVEVDRHESPRRVYADRVPPGDRVPAVADRPREPQMRMRTTSPPRGFPGEFDMLAPARTMTFRETQAERCLGHLELFMNRFAKMDATR